MCVSLSLRVLDPITITLTNFQDSADLRERMDKIYELLDSDGSGGLNFDEFKESIKRFPGSSRIHMTGDDFDVKSLPLSAEPQIGFANWHSLQMPLGQG